MNKIYVQQLDESDCGAAALAMILKYFKSTIPISVIRRRAQTDKEGTTALGLIEAAHSFKLDTKAIKSDLSLFEINDLSVPFIAHVDKEQGLLHYVVISRVDKGIITVLDPDPAVKEEKMSVEKFGTLWTGIAMFFNPSRKYTNIKDRSDSLWHTARVLLKHKTIIFSIILLMVITTLISIGGAFFLQNIIDVIVPEKRVVGLEFIGLGLLISYVFHGFFTHLEGHLAVLLSKRMSVDILLNYIRHLFKLPLAFFDTRRVGEITARFNDANSIIESLSQTAITTVLNMGTIIIVGVALAIINIRLMSLLFLAIPLYLLLIIPFIEFFDRQNNNRMEKNAALNSQLIESLNGIASIKSMNSENKMYALVQDKFKDAIETNYKYGVTSVIQHGLKDTASLLINLSVLFFGSFLAIRGQISLGSLIAFNALLGYFFGPLEELINLQDNLQTAKIANARLNQVLLSPDEENTSGIGQTMGQLRNFKSIEYKNVSFEYKYSQKILHNVSFKVSKGESTAIVGFSGSGKTTLAKILVNFYRSNSGQVLVNGIQTTKIENKALRSLIFYLPQNPYLFSGTIAENIALANPEVKLEKIIDAAKLAEIHQVILGLPDGYDTQISEGTGLSGGQLQRLAIARAIVSSAEVLVLDESTSNLDLLTEKKVLQNLLKISNKTVIFIAHRLEIAKQVDKIIVMSGGEVIEEGTHSQLMSVKGVYHNLVS